MYQFLALVSDTPGPHSAHLDTYVTMFAPTNEALESYGGPRDQNFILNHLGESHLSIYVLLSFVIFIHLFFCLPSDMLRLSSAVRLHHTTKKVSYKRGRSVSTKNLPPNNSVVQLYCI